MDHLRVMEALIRSQQRRDIARTLVGWTAWTTFRIGIFGFAILWAVRRLCFLLDEIRAFGLLP